MAFKKTHFWEVDGIPFLTEAAADRYIDHEKRIERAAGLLEDLLSSFVPRDFGEGPRVHRSGSDPKMRKLMSNSSMALSDSSELVARAFAQVPEVLASLQDVFADRRSPRRGLPDRPADN